MLQIHTNPSDYASLKLDQSQALFQDTTYLVELDVCQDAECDCYEGELVIVKQEAKDAEDVECIFPFDLSYRKFDTTTDDLLFVKDKKYQSVPKMLEQQLSETDWQLLTKQYRSSKLHAISLVKAEQLHYTFSQEHLDNESLLLPFQEVSPLSALFVELEGQVYYLFEAYCKDDQCKCEDVVIDIVVVDDASGDYKEIGTYAYNYGEQSLVFQEGENRTLTDQILQIFHDNYDLNDIFYKRNRLIRKRYKLAHEADTKAHLLDLFNAEAPGEAEWEIMMNTDKNDDCPCGSGKQFKNCCMKKGI